MGDDKLPVKDWHNSLPAKHISSKVLTFNQAGELLVVDSPVSDKVSIPGGVIEVGESPQQGAAREFEEEVGVAISATDLKLVGVNYRNQIEQYNDFIHFVFVLGKHISIDVTSDSSNQNPRFMAISSIKEADRSQSLIIALAVQEDSAGMVYYENEEPLG